MSPTLPTKHYLYIAQPEDAVLLTHPADRYRYESTHSIIEFPNSVYLFADPSVPTNQIKAFSSGFMDRVVKPRDTEYVQLRWKTVLQTLLVAFAPSLVMFGLGAAFVWAFAGFRREHDATSA